MAKLRILNSQLDVYNSQLRKSLNTYEEFTQDFIDGGVNPNSDKVPDSITDSVIQEWLSNPDENIEEIMSYMTYLYCADGNIYQLYTLMSSLPKLNYKIRAFDKKIQGYEETLVKCDKILYQVNYKKLTRDIISQLCATGNVVCAWLGNKASPYLYIFPSDEYIFAGYRVNGEWVVQMDMARFEEMQEFERNIQLETFKPLGVDKQYKKYLRDREKYKYMILPQDKVTVLRSNTLYSNQRMGLPMGIQSLFDISHKNALRLLDKSIVEKAVKGISVLKIGDDVNSFDSINKALKQKIIKSVQSAISNAKKSKGIGGLAILPNFADLEFSEMNGLDALSDKKFDTINNDINSSIGMSASITGGSGSNFQTSKINLGMIYSRIDAMLETIEPIFRKLFTITLTKQLSNNIMFEFVKGEPLSNSESLDAISKLGAMGYSVKAIVDMLPTTSYTELLTDSLYEIETLKLREKIIPPQTSFTLSSDGGDVGAPVNENPDNPNTIASQQSGGNLVDGGE